MIKKDIVFRFLLCPLLIYIIITNCAQKGKKFPKQWHIYGIDDIFREKNLLIVFVGYKTKKEVFYSQGRRKHHIYPVSKSWHIVYNWEDQQVIKAFESSLESSKRVFHFSPNAEYLGFLGSSKYRRPEQGFNSIYLYDIMSKWIKEFVSSRDTFNMIDDWAWFFNGEWIAYERIVPPGYSELRIKNFQNRREKKLAIFTQRQKNRYSEGRIAKIVWINSGILLISSKGLELFQPFREERKLLCGADSLLDFSVLPGDTEIILLLGNKKNKNKVRINILNVLHMEIKKKDSLEYFPFLKALDKNHILLYNSSSFTVITQENKERIRMTGISPFWKDKETIFFVSIDEQQLRVYDIKTGNVRKILNTELLESLLKKRKL